MPSAEPTGLQKFTESDRNKKHLATENKLSLSHSLAQVWCKIMNHTAVSYCDILQSNVITFTCTFVPVDPNILEAPHKENSEISHFKINRKANEKHK